MSFVERVGLLPRASIAISILSFRTLISIMSSLLALVASDLAQISLSWGRWVGTVLSVASSIPITILGYTMVVRTSYSMGMLKRSSRIRGKTWLLMSSKIVLPLSILPLAAFNLLLLPFNHESSIYQLLVVVEGFYHQLQCHLGHNVLAY